MAKNILKYSLVFISMAFSFLSWQRVASEINSPETSNWLWPIILFSLFFISLYLTIVLIRQKYILNLLALFCLSLSFVFIPNLWHTIGVLFGFLLVSIGIFHIRRDLQLNIKVNLGKTLTTGKQFLILGFAIVLSSQYFLTVNKKDFEEIIPRFSENRYSNLLTSKILSTINPEFEKISTSEITLDEFIIESQKSQFGSDNISMLSDQEIENSLSGIGDRMPPGQKEELRKEVKDNLSEVNTQLLEGSGKRIIEEVRKKFSALVGSELTGQEKFSEVLNNIINRKVTDYLKPEIRDKNSISLLPPILTIILFLTIVPLGSLLNIFWMPICRLIFWILIKSKIITINKVSAMVEILE